MNGLITLKNAENKIFSACLTAESLQILIIGRVKTVRSDLLIPDFSPYPLELRSILIRDIGGVQRAVARLSPPGGGFEQVVCDFFALEGEEDIESSWAQMSGFLHTKIMWGWAMTGLRVTPHVLLTLRPRLLRPGLLGSELFVCGGLCLTSDGVVYLYPKGNVTVFDYHLRALVRGREQMKAIAQFELQAQSVDERSGRDRFPVIVSALSDP